MNGGQKRPAMGPVVAWLAPAPADPALDGPDAMVLLEKLPRTIFVRFEVSWRTDCVSLYADVY